MAGIPQKDTTTLRHVAPYIMAGNSITFVPAHHTEDIESNGGFAPTSRHTVVCQACQNRPCASVASEPTTGTPPAEETDTESMFCLPASSCSISPVTNDAHPSVHPVQIPVRASSIPLTAARVTFANPLHTTFGDCQEIGVVENSMTSNLALLPDGGISLPLTLTPVSRRKA